MRHNIIIMESPLTNPPKIKWTVSLHHLCHQIWMCYFQSADQCMTLCCRLINPHDYTGIIIMCLIHADPYYGYYDNYGYWDVLCSDICSIMTCRVIDSIKFHPPTYKSGPLQGSSNTIYIYILWNYMYTLQISCGHPLTQPTNIRLAPACKREHYHCMDEENPCNLIYT